MIIDLLILLAVITGTGLLIFTARLLAGSRLIRWCIMTPGFIFIPVFLIHQYWPGLMPGFISAWKVEYLLLTATLSSLAGVRSRMVKTPREKRLFFIFITLGLVLSVLPFLLRPFMRLYWKDSETSIRDGVCIQQAGYNCGAASLCTILLHYGLEFSEAEAVLATWTVPILGTEPDMIALGIESMSMSSLRASVRRTTFAELAKEPLPCIISLSWPGPVSHYVVLFQLTPRIAIIGDPLVGIVEHPVSWFEKRYRGHMICVSQK